MKFILVAQLSRYHSQLHGDFIDGGDDEFFSLDVPTAADGDGLRVHVSRRSKALAVVWAQLLLSASLWPQSATTNSVDALGEFSSSLLASSEASAAEPPAYTRPTERQKFHDFALNTFGPVAFASAAIAGAIDQGFSSPHSWDQGMGGYGARVASVLGMRLVAAGTEYSLAEVFREDTAYYRCSCRGFFRRFWYAAVSTLSSRRGYDGHRSFSPALSVSPFIGPLTATDTWFPGRDGFAVSLRTGTRNLLGQLGQNEALEFLYGGPHTLVGRIRPRPFQRR